MNTVAPNKENFIKMSFFLSELSRSQIYFHESQKKIGRLQDLLVEEKGALPEITHLCISQPFGEPMLYIPFNKVKNFELKKISVNITQVKDFEKAPYEELVFLKDYVLDKKVIDIEDNEVEIVYDLKLALINERLFVTDADISKFGLLRRMHLLWVFELLGKSIEQKTISWKYIQALPTELGSFKGRLKLNVLREKLSEIPSVDLADILEELDPDQRVVIFDGLENAQASDILEEIEPTVQRSLVSSLKKEKVASLINEMTPAQASDILAILPYNEAKEILELLDKEIVKKIQATLEHQEQSIQNLATEKFISISPSMKVGEAEDEFRSLARGKDVIMYLYVIEENKKIVGIVDLKELLQADNDLLVADIMSTNIISLNPQSNLREASDLFERYGYRALPLLDEEEKVLGIVPYRDVMELNHRT